jgi:hypothetical protein
MPSIVATNETDRMSSFVGTMYRTVRSNMELILTMLVEKVLRPSCKTTSVNFQRVIKNNEKLKFNKKDKTWLVPNSQFNYQQIIHHNINM